MQNIIRISLFVSLAIIVFGCANPVTPSGGPKDEVPPQILRMDPPNYSTSVKATNRFSIQFDEFVKLQGLDNQLMISPPLNEKPDIRPKGKSIVIDINESLRDSTTYTFFFGDAITDITEGNPLKNFEYVFSTGPLLDSMAVKGRIIDAFKKTPREGVAVMLYTLNVDKIPNDSLPILSRPVYVSRTNKEGEFELNNLRNLPYMIIALADMNSNYLYDLPNEQIAFSDTIIKPAFLGRKVYKQLSDTASVDLEKKQTDKGEKQIDKPKANNPNEKKVAAKPEFVSILTGLDTYGYKPIELSMFQVIDSTQQIVNSGVSKGSLITINLKFPAKDFKLTPLNFRADSAWNVLESNATNDTILCWVRKGVQDSLKLEFMADSRVIDTLSFVINKVNPNIQIDTTKREPLLTTPNLKMGVIELNRKLRIESEYPLVHFSDSGIKWFEADTMGICPEFKFKDSAKRILYVDKILEEKVDYKLIVPDSAMVDMKGRFNDSIVYEFKTREKEEYGTIQLNITVNDTTQQWILQLLNEDQSIVSQHIINKDATLKFEYLNPAKYSLKAILDENKNGYWDTGNYLMHRQSEKILIFKTEIEVRANWLMEEEWDLK